MALTAEAARPSVGLDAALASAQRLEVDALRRLGTVIVFAPHADDESLGCGGLLALLQDAGSTIVPVLVTDGAASHPNARRHDAAARAAIRNAEWLDALARLGLTSPRGVGLGLPDGAVPRSDTPAFDLAADRVRALFAEHRPGLVVLPWRRDPHPDHRATHALVSAALGRWRGPGSLRSSRAPSSPRCLEYIVWASERAQTDDLPRDGEVQAWRLDIASVVERKRAAIAAHRSQHGEVFTDDPGGFTIDPAMRRRAEQPFEYFFEAKAP